MNLWRQDKGQAACVKAFVEAIKAPRAAESDRHGQEGPAGPVRITSPIPLGEILEVAEVTIKLVS